MGVFVAGVVGVPARFAWLWWSSLIAGVIAYATAIGVHYAVGYLSVKHLLPAFSGLVVLVVGLMLSYSFLCGRNE